MKNLVLVIFSIITCSACQEYSSHYPIGKPSQSTIKSVFSGDWEFVSATKLNTSDDIGYGQHFMRITPFNDQEFLIQLVSDSLKNIKDINHFRGYVTTIKNINFANVSPVGNEGKRPIFSIYKYRLKGDSLIFHGISQETFESLNIYINSEGQHKKFIKSSLDNMGLWDTEYKYVKYNRI